MMMGDWKKKVFLFVVLTIAAASFAGFEWTGVEATDRIGGRMISAGYLRGKVVVLDCRDYGDASAANVEAIRWLQTLWATYKTKPFIVLGSHRGAESDSVVAARLRDWGVSYPVYRRADLASANAPTNPRSDDDKTILVVDSTCSRRLYRGSDLRAVGGVVGSALMEVSVPMTPKAFSSLLDYEITHLPGRAYLRLKDFRARFPKDAKAYHDTWKKFSADSNIKRLAKLCEIARKAKDRNPADKKAKRLTPQMIDREIKKYADLKTNENPYIAQEAKNALADLTWAKAALK